MALNSAEGRPYTTTGTVEYTKDSPTEDLYRNVYEDTTGSLTLEEQEKRSTNLERTTTEVRVEDLRPSADHFTLRTNGFALKKLAVPNDIDWEDKKMVGLQRANHMLQPPRPNLYFSSILAGSFSWASLDCRISPAAMMLKFFTNCQVEGQYYPLAAEMLKKETGASRVHIFDHTLRQGHVR